MTKACHQILLCWISLLLNFPEYQDSCRCQETGFLDCSEPKSLKFLEVEGREKRKIFQIYPIVLNHKEIEGKGFPMSGKCRLKAVIFQKNKL